MRARSLSLPAVLLAACAVPPPDAGFDDVQKVVADRTGMTLRWNPGGEADAQVDATIRDLLARELAADDAVQIALLSNRNLQAIFEEIGIAQADLVQAGLLRNPVFGVEIRFPGTQTAPLELHVEQNFLDLLTMSMRKTVASERLEETKLRVANAVLDLAADVRARFYALQGAQQLVEMRRSVADATAASADAARRFRDAGNLTELELASEVALREQSRLELADAEAAVVDAREALQPTMGRWGASTRWRSVARLPELPEKELASAGLESLAVSSRLDLAAARHQVEAVAQSLGLTEDFALLSDLELGAHYEREPEGDGSTGPSLSVPLPIFDQGQAKIARASAELRQSRERFAALAIQIRSEVRLARERMLAARRKAEFVRAVLLPVRRAVVEQSQLQYNAMQIGVFALLESKRQEIDTGRAWVESVRDYWVARAELAHAVGGRLPDSTASTTPSPLRGTR